MTVTRLTSYEVFQTAMQRKEKWKQGFLLDYNKPELRLMVGMELAMMGPQEQAAIAPEMYPAIDEIMRGG